MQDAEKRVVDRAEQALRQNGHFIQFQDSQGILGNDPQEALSESGKKVKKNKDKDKKEGGCLIF